MTSKPTLVIDNGSGLIKAGLAGEHAPSSIFSNYVARPKNSGAQDDLHIGSYNEDLGEKLAVEYPMEYGVVKNWNDMEKIWKYIYSKDQLGLLPEEHPVLLSEAALNSRPNREKYAEIFYEKFGVPALCLSMQAVLSLYSTGRVTGIVLNSGDGVSDAVPIYQGFALQFGVKRIDVAGRDITKYLRLLLKKERIDFHTSTELETVRKIKENLSCLLVNTAQQNEQASYTLPDGRNLLIGPSRFQAPEVLFHPHLIGEECEGIHELLKNAVQNSDLDLRSYLYKNIVLSGGSTLIKGFGNRLLSEMKNICPRNLQLKIHAPKERLYSVWIGGSILSSLDTFKGMWLSKKDYEEYGKLSVFNKMHCDVVLDQYYMCLREHNII